MRHEQIFTPKMRLREKKTLGTIGFDRRRIQCQIELRILLISNLFLNIISFFLNCAKGVDQKVMSVLL